MTFTRYRRIFVVCGALLAAGGCEAAPADQPVPRKDPNSLAAHRELLAKAQRGGIDLYFVGDSIVRRWGTSDATYRDLLANWTANFHGWNAGNFGWGADRIEHILWRLEHGELDHVHPRVIVILAGTNNLGSPPISPEADIVAGLKAVIAVCRRKAPAATIIITGIFPRQDPPGLLPVITRINEALARLADGKSVRYLNINDRLAGRDGRLLPDVMTDGLHPTVKGYQIWADGLQPLLTEVLGPRSPADHAPPPTGDPSASAK